VNVAGTCVEPAPSPGDDFFEEHLSMVRAIIGIAVNEVGQQTRRALEHRTRRRAVAVVSALAALGHDRTESAHRLGLSERTLRQWEYDLGDKPMSIPSLGRPMADSGPEQQQSVVHLLNVCGPGVTVATLREHFPTMARNELTELLRGYRQAWRSQHRRAPHVLRWLRPGTVWAMDFAEPPNPIDGRFPYLLAVRDLASGRNLLWRPVEADNAEVVIRELKPLFMSHGAPWVMKTDNGPAFIADPLARFLGRWQCLSLFSPPYTPSYNGSIEASIRSLKTRSERRAAELGHPGQWTSAVVEAARQEANATARPRRLHGATPDDVWFVRRPMTAVDRDQFRATVDRMRQEVHIEKRLPAVEELSRNEQAGVDRIAIRRALVAHDLLLFRRKSIPAPIERPKVTSKA
jgi:transposase InsO family protein